MFYRDTYAEEKTQSVYKCRRKFIDIVSKWQVKISIVSLWNYSATDFMTYEKIHSLSCSVRANELCSCDIFSILQQMVELKISTYWAHGFTTIYPITSEHELILSASALGISTANSSSKAITSSTVSKLSSPRSWKPADSVTCMRQILARYNHSVTKCKEWKNYTIGNSEESIPKYHMS